MLRLSATTLPGPCHRGSAGTGNRAMSDAAHRHRNRRGMLLAVAATLMFACADTLSKFLASRYPVNQVAFARYSVPMVLLAIVYGPRRGRALLATSQPGLQVLRGLLLTGATLSIVLAMHLMPIAEAQAISFVHPLLLTLIAVLFLRERVHPSAWLAVAIGFAGVLLIVRPGGGYATPAALLPLAMALCYASYQALTRHVTASDSPVNSLFLVMLVGSTATAASLPFSHGRTDLRGALLLACAGLFSGSGHFCMIHALRSSPASRLAPLAYVQVAWIIVLGAWAFGNVPKGWTLLGIGLVVAGGLVATLGRKAPGVPVPAGLA